MTFAMGGKGDHQKRAEKLKAELNLTDEQMAKVSEIRKNKWKDHKENKKILKTEKEAFRAALKDPNISNDVLITKFESLQKIKNENQRKKFNMMLEMRSVLNPDQLEKFRALKKEHRGDRRGRKSNS
jgi:Spy/CpxP family protein refolding chaperone